MTTPARFLLAVVLCASCVTDPPDVPADAGTPEPEPVVWDTEPAARPCRVDASAPLLDQALDTIGRTRTTFGSSETDLAASDYERAGYLDDEFVRSWFKPLRAAPVRLPCFEGRAAFPLDTYLGARHGVASAIRHAARLLDRPPSNAPPPDPADVPGDFFDALQAVCDAAPGELCGDRVGTLDPALADALTPVLYAMVNTAKAQFHRQDATPARTPTWWQQYGANLLVPAPGKPAPKLDDPADRAYLLGETGLAELYESAARLAFAIQHADLKRFSGVSDAAFEQDTPLGTVRIAGADLDVHADDGRAYFLLLDVGGDDAYLGPVGANRVGKRNPVSVAIDLGGKDHYGYDGSGPAPADGILAPDAAGRYRGNADVGPFTLSTTSRQGGARDGVAFLFDLGGADDSYTSLVGSQGAAHQGVGVLFDDGGNDTYRSESTSQGSAQFGIGLLLDAGAGNDTHRAFTESQGFGYVGGAGFLVDGGGNDTYLCDLGDPALGGAFLYPSPQLPRKGNSSFCQGAGFGRRGTTEIDHLSGGLGILRDLGGDDSYEASVFAQGTGYWQSTGLLSDAGGNDAYDAAWYVQGAAAHYSVGYLGDGGGDDAYDRKRPAINMHLGAGHDFSVGVFVDDGGNDDVRISSLGAGASNCNGMGLFVTNGGDDTYEAANDYGSGMGNVSGECLTTRPGAASLGVMIDAGGHDTYTYPASDFPVPADGASWGHERNSLPSEGGAGLDAEGESGVHVGG